MMKIDVKQVAVVSAYTITLANLTQVEVDALLTLGEHSDVVVNALFQKGRDSVERFHIRTLLDQLQIAIEAARR